MNRRRLRVLALAVVVALGGLLGVQEASYASAASPRTITIPVGHLPPTATGSVGAGLTDWWQVGDCWMQPGSYAEIEGNVLHVHAITSTDYTSHADIWHNGVAFLDARGRALAGVLVTTGQLDSPPMTPISGSSGPSDVITWDRWAPVPSRPPYPVLETQTVSVSWTGSC